MTKKLIIQGGQKLKGAVRLGGAKNASFKLMIASLLSSQEVRLLNFSNIADVQNTKEIICALGGKISSCGERTLSINAKGLKEYQIPAFLGDSSRASTMFIGPLIARFGQAIVPFPGGDKIGPRPLDRHFSGLQALGVKIDQKKGVIKAQGKLIGGRYRFIKNTHTGTETLIMAAVLARGQTILENVAQEPEVDELINFLNKMGAKIKRIDRILTIQGVRKLGSVIYKIMPDRNEAVSYAIAALITKGDIVVENAVPGHIQSFLDKLEEAGGGYEISNYGIRFYYKNQLKAVDIITKPFPGFMTDWQPLWSVLATQSYGISRIIESVYLDRFAFVPELKQMGAIIKFFQPKVKNPQTFYNFNLTDNWDKIPHGIEIKGPTVLSSVEARIPDLRAGATLLLAGLVANRGQTVLEDIFQIDRGYENLDGRLAQLGAKITRG